MTILLGNIEHAKALLNLYYLDVDLGSFMFCIQEQRALKLDIHGRMAFSPLIESEYLKYIDPDIGDVTLSDVEAFRKLYGEHACTPIQYVDLIICKKKKMMLVSDEPLILDIAVREQIVAIELHEFLYMIENKEKKAI